jgi:hypothetical protein
MMWSRALLTTLACTQLSLVAAQRYRAPLAVTGHRPQPEGISRVVDRIANSKYGLLGRLPHTPSDPKLTGTPLSELLIVEPEVARPVETPANTASEQSPTWLWPIIEGESRQRGLDPFLIESVIRVESGFQPEAVSPVGAQGLMQLMPDTARLVGVENPFDPQQNVAGGSQYLSWQVQDFGGDLSLALAAYNAGPAAVRRWGGIPPYGETNHYVRNVLEDYRRKVQTGSPQGSTGEFQQDYPR